MPEIRETFRAVRNRLFSRQPRKLTESELESLLFGQQHIYTQEFFTRELGQAHTVPLPDFPHFRLLTVETRTPAEETSYYRYLECSWRFYSSISNNSHEGRLEQIARLRQQYRTAAESRPWVAAPLLITKPVNGRRIRVDGNHRASIALATGQTIHAREISAEEFVRRVAKLSGEFYGAGHRGMPYQSIAFGGKRLLPGRRNDIDQRMALIKRSDLEGRTILDLGCNLGMASHLAIEKGATHAIGVEKSELIASAAARLNAIFGNPFQVKMHDLGIPLATGPHDTVFCFSVSAHVQNKAALRATLIHAVGNVLYLEGHAGSTAGDYKDIVDETYFPKMEQLGYLADGTHNNRRSRPFFRCVRVR